MIKVAVYEVGKNPEIRSIEYSEEICQQIVGGELAQVRLNDGNYTVIFNKTHKYDKSIRNRIINLHKDNQSVICGTFIVFKGTKKHMVSIDESDVERLNELTVAYPSEHDRELVSDILTKVYKTIVAKQNDDLIFNLTRTIFECADQYNLFVNFNNGGEVR